MLIEIIILSLLFFNHCHSYIAVHFLEMFFITCLLYFLLKFLLIFGYRLQLAANFGSALRLIVTRRHWCRYRGLRLLLGYCYDYTIHRSQYTSAHVLIENTLVQHKMAKNSHMALCCQNLVSQGTNQCYGLHDRACIFVHSALVMVLGLLKKKKKELVQNGFCHFQVSYLKHSNGSYKWLR